MEASIGLTNDGFSQHALHFQQFCGFLLLHFFERDAGPFGHNQPHILFMNFDNFFVVLLAPLRQLLFEGGAGLTFRVAELGGFLEALLTDGLVALALKARDFFFTLFQRGRTSHGADARARRLHQ